MAARNGLDTMLHTELHVMTVELIADRQTVRYSCPICHRCLEDGPDGIIIIHKGDQEARHRGGNIATLGADIEQDRPRSPVLH
jgi:hypothetical protein